MYTWETTTLHTADPPCEVEVCRVKCLGGQVGAACRWSSVAGVVHRRRGRLVALIHRRRLPPTRNARARKPDGVELDLEVRARLRCGWFSRADAVDCGYSDADLAAAIKRGELLRLRQGAYVFRSAYEGCDPIQQHLLLARAALARQGGPVALAGPSAAALHGLVLHDVDLTKVHLVRLDKGAPRREAGIVHHAVRDDVANHIVIRHELPAVNVGRTVWEMASMSIWWRGCARPTPPCGCTPRAKRTLPP